jgi:Flp pilus assembly protein TadG
MRYMQHYDSREHLGDRRIRLGRPQRPGAAVVEFAIVGPILFIMILAMFEFGRTLMVMELLTEGARVGCRLAIIEGTTSAQIQQAVTTYLAGVGINGDTVGVIVNDAPVNSVEAANQPAYAEMTVQVTVPVTSISWVPNPLFTSGTLKGQFTMRRE